MLLFVLLAGMWNVEDIIVWQTMEAMLLPLCFVAVLVSLVSFSHRIYVDSNMEVVLKNEDGFESVRRFGE